MSVTSEELSYNNGDRTITDDETVMPESKEVIVPAVNHDKNANKFLELLLFGHKKVLTSTFFCCCSFWLCNSMKVFNDNV